MKPDSKSHSYSNSYLIDEEDIAKVKNLIEALHLAVGEILESRKISDPPEETPALDEFDDKWELAMQESGWRIEHVKEDDF